MNNAVEHTKAAEEKILFHLEDDQWHGYTTERLWAEQPETERYRLRNSPFFVFGVSAEDEVLATQESSGQLIFREVYARGGHSTYRVITAQGVALKDFEKSWKPLQYLDCTFDRESTLDASAVAWTHERDFVHGAEGLAATVHRNGTRRYFHVPPFSISWPAADPSWDCRGSRICGWSRCTYRSHVHCRCCPLAWVMPRN